MHQHSALHRVIKGVLIGTALLFFYSTVAAKPNEIISNKFSPFLSLEGSYSWRDINGISFLDQTASKTNQPWGGRVALGIEFVLMEKLRLTNELAFGYYGSTTIRHPQGYSLSHDIDGEDLLVGILYKYSDIDWFFKVGGIVENRYSKIKSTNDELTAAFSRDHVKAHHQEIAVLPEIKIGGIYAMNQKWGLSLSYAHVIGSRMQGNLDILSTNNGIELVRHETSLNPSIDSIMLGIRYVI